MKIFRIVILGSVFTLYALFAENSNGLPNLSARFSAEGRGFDCSATLLIWTAREIGADCWAEVITPPSAPISNELAEVQFGWDPGFRVGLGYGMEYDEWGTRAFFTWFQTRGDDRVQSVSGSVHSSFIGNFYVDNPTGAGISGPSYKSASIRWTILFNVFDWELSRNYWVSQGISLCPFLGLKGGWINQTIDSQWNDATPPPGFPTYRLGEEKIHNDFSGIGPSLGINTRWRLLQRGTHFLNLFGDFSGALMWGRWSFSDSFHNDLHQQVKINQGNVNSGAAMIRSFTGFSWNTLFNQNKARFSARLGYEAQFWLDQLQFYSFVGGTLDTALTLQGGSLELAIDF